MINSRTITNEILEEIEKNWIFVYQNRDFLFAKIKTNLDKAYEQGFEAHKAISKESRIRLEEKNAKLREENKVKEINKTGTKRSLEHEWSLEQENAKFREENAKFREENARLQMRVDELKTGIIKAIGELTIASKEVRG